MLLVVDAAGVAEVVPADVAPPQRRGSRRAVEAFGFAALAELLLQKVNRLPVAHHLVLAEEDEVAVRALHVIVLRNDP